MKKHDVEEVTVKTCKESKLNKIMQDILRRVKDNNHRTPTGYSRMHHRHSRS